LESFIQVLRKLRSIWVNSNNLNEFRGKNKFGEITTALFKFEEVYKGLGDL